MIRSIGRYEIQEELGRGGFGRVYRAFDPKVARLVAIKTLTGAGEGEMLQRFHNEAAAAGRLHHKNIVTIFDFGEHEGEPFIVMELLQGEDLARIISRRTPLTLLQKMLIMSQVADGLHHAHVEGIVHRDVKPANIMVLPDGTVKLMDFGIALVTQSAGSRLTKTGMVPGTLRYMAPEQFKGATNEPLSDIFAYGVTYHELLTCNHPFEGPTEPAMMFNIMTSPPAPLRESCPECPEALEQVLLRAMQKERELRYASFEELQDDLRPVLTALKQQRSMELIEQAGGLMSAGNLTEARAAVREGLELDPGNTTGHHLRKQLQQALQIQVSRPRVEALLQTGREQLRERRFDEAIASFESALNLHPADNSIRSAVSEARLAQQQSRKADQLAYEAYQVLKAGDLTAAEQKASLAVQTDPASPRAVAIMQRIEETRRARERQRKLQAGLDQAKAALLVGSVQEALGLLTSLRTEFPGEAEVEQLHDAALREQAARERRVRIEERTAAAKDLIRSSRLADAVQLLRSVEREFPEATEARDLLRHAEHELAVRRRSEAVARAAAEAEALAREEKFQGARDTLDRAMEALGEEASLRSLRARIAAAESQYRRRKALQDTVSTAARMRAERRFDEAVGRIDAFEAEHGQEPELAALRRSIAEEASRLKRAAAIASAADRARGILETGDAAGAIGILSEAVRALDAQAELSPLLERAQAALAAQQLREEIQGIADEARRLAAQPLFEEALGLLDRGLAAHPGESALEQARLEIAAAQAAHDRKLERERALEEARRLLAQGDLGGAARRLSEAERDYEADADTAELGRQIRAAEEAEARRRALVSERAEVRKLIAEERLEAALDRAASANKRFPGDAELRALHEKASAKLNERRRVEAVAAATGEAKDLMAGRRFGAALAVLDRALLAHPGELALLKLRKQAAEAKEADDREQALRAAVSATLSAARSALDQGQPTDAVWELETAPEEVRRDPSVAALLVKAREALKRKEQEDAAVQRLSAQVARLTQGGNFDEALWLLDQGLSDFPRHPGLLEAKTAAESAKRAFEEEQERAAARRRRDEYVARIETLAGEQRFPEALALLEEAARDCGEDGDFAPLRKEIEEKQELHRRALARQRDLDELRLLEERIVSEDDKKQAKALGKQAHRLAKPYSKEAEFQERLARTDAAIRAKAGVPRAAAALGAAWWRRVPRWALAAPGILAASAVLGVLLTRQGGKPPAPAPAPAGAQSPSRPPPSSPPAQTRIEAGREQPIPKPGSPARERAPSQTQARELRPPAAVPETVAPLAQPPQPAPAPGPDPAAEAAAAARRAAAEQALDDQRWAAVDKGALAAVRDFARRYPGSRHAGEALEMERKLEWEALDKNNLNALEDYRRRAAGEYANLAAREMERLRRERIEAEQNRQVQAQLERDRQAILSVLARHGAAYEKRDLNEILATWPAFPKPGLDLLRRAFQTRGASTKMTLRPLGQPEIRGDGASVVCEQVREAVMGGARRNPDTRRVNVRLSRRGSGWIIEGMQ